jgi:energy-coupling factor transport system ATP-binding protein
LAFLDIRSLSFSYSDRGPVLKDLDLSLDRGEKAVVLGRSGSGKSTLMRCLNGVIPHIIPGRLEGSLQLEGRELREQPPEARSLLIGSVLQDFEAQLLHLNVEDELSFGPENLGLPREEIERRVQEISGVVGLQRGWGTRRLSGGQRQRLCIGAVLCMGSDLLVMDEPLSNLDRPGACQLLAFLDRLAAMGKTILMFEHRADLLHDWADRRLWMEDGGLMDGWPERLCAPRYARGAGIGREVLRMQGISFRYPGLEHVISQVDLRVEEGESLVVLGNNGSGKSTLLSLIAGLRIPDRGEIVLMGRRLGLNRLSRTRGKIGLVLQNPNHQLFMRSVWEEVRSQCQDERWAEEMLRTFELYHLRGRHPYTLSEGEKRRLALASVLVTRPNLLLLDEPTLGQDQDSMIKMIGCLNRHREEMSMALITVTHDREAAGLLGDRVLLLRDGHISEGPVQKMLDMHFTLERPVEPSEARLN